MLNDPMDHTQKGNPALPESLRQAVREAEASGRAAEERAHLAMPFRARLRARDAVRPRPTLSILTGSAPVTAAPAVMRLPPPPKPAPVAARKAEPEEVRALKRTPPPAPPKPVRDDTRPTVPAPVAVVPLPKSGTGSPHPANDDDDDDERGWKFGEFSQFAFAGLAVLGLAGLSVMAAERALNGGREGADTDANTNLLMAESLPASEVSTAALGAATAPVQPWFDFNATAELLKTRLAKIEAEEKEAARLAQADADREAALAIANGEAARVAAEQPAAAAGPTVIDARLRDRLATEEALRQANLDEAARLKAEQDAIAAKAEADRIAAEEAARAAAAQAEAKRLADLEAKQAAEAEAKRLADLAAKQKAAEAEAKRLADLEAKQKADAEAKRLADLAAQRKAADAEAKRLADLAAQKKAAEAEAKRLADLEIKREADEVAARLAAAAIAATPAEPKRLSVPPAGAPSLKPARPAPEVVLADDGPTVLTAPPVERAAPPSLSASPPEVRALALPRPVDEFIAERAEYTAGHELDDAGLATLRADFLTLVEESPDGSHHELTTPDGRALLIHFERTVPVDPMKASVHAIGYLPSSVDAVTRGYLQPVSVNVHVMCRDVAYAFPGQERGRFAACQGDDGTWRMARATNVTAAPI